jgi:hypothetical protein
MGTASPTPPFVFPAKAGIQEAFVERRPRRWIPAFAGMTEGE